jgi:FkbM family methyltransferase
MGRLVSIASRYYASARLLGTASAFRIGLAKFRGRKSDAVAAQVRVGGMPAEMWVRPSTSDLDVVLQILGEKDYEMRWCAPYRQHIEDLCARITEEGCIPLIIDAGANIGASTLLLARSFPGCHVFAIEPESGNFEILRRHVAGVPDVTLFHTGLWDQPVELAITDELGTGWACRVREGTGGSAMKGITVPELLAKDARLRLVIVKIDIEGAETKLLRSHNEWIDDVPLVIFEEHDNLWQWLGPWQGTGHAFFSVLARRKREYLTRGENIFAFLHPDEIQRRSC